MASSTNRRKRQQQQQNPPNPVNPAPAVFSLTPYNISNVIIDYSTQEGRKHYDRATEKLNDDKFDCQSDHLRSFLEDLSRRAKTFGWSEPSVGIMQIPKDLNDPTQGYYDLIANYGEVDIDHLRTFEQSYIGQQTRAAQDSSQLYNCLMNSLSKEATDIITIWKDDYMIQEMPSGNLLLRVIIRESHIDTNASASAVRQKLSNLDVYMATVDSDIAKFNQYVKQQLAILASRGEQTMDLLTNLFKGYAACSDPVFRRYIEQKQEKHDEGTTITPNELMQWAKLKFGIIKENGLWNAPTKQEQQLLALKAEINNLKKSSGNKNKNKQGQKNQQKQKDKNPNQRGKPDWMYSEPEEKELTRYKMWRGKKWYWCGQATGGKCEEYRCHHPNTCKGLARKLQNSTPKEKPEAAPSTEIQPTKPKPKRKVNFDDKKISSKQIKLTKALSNAAIVSRDDEDSG